MNKFLEQYKVKIKTLSPVFIGSGESLTKKEYLYNPEEKKVIGLNFGKVFSEIKTGKESRELRNYFMKENKKGLQSFLDEKEICIKNEWIEFEYSVDGAESVFADEKFRGIELCMKDAFGNPFIPGSSLKGAIRTALLKYKIHNGQDKLSNDISSILEKPGEKYVKKELSRLSKKTEQKELLVNLSVNKKDGKPASYDVMKGFIISDSKSLSTKDLTICQKIDRKPNAEENSLPILRECIKPGTEVEFLLTIDRTYFKESIEIVKQSIQCAYKSLREWKEAFLPNEAEEREKSTLLYLGGGVGYVSKTFTYDLLSKDDAKLVAKKTLPKPGKTGRYDDSFVPRTIKKTMMNGEYFDMGLCSVEFENLD